MSFFISAELSDKIKKSLLGYDPDVFTSMFRMRDNILESLDEGIVAVDKKGKVQFINKSAVEMLTTDRKEEAFIGKYASNLSNSIPALNPLCASEASRSVSSAYDNILIDTIPIRENGSVTGTVSILHDRKKYTKLMEAAGGKVNVESQEGIGTSFTVSFKK